MKVLIPIKRVIDPYAKVKPLPDGTGIDTSAVKFDINPFDEIAMEEAVRIKEKDGSVELVAVAIGGAECEEQLRKALAIGADRAILIESSEVFDSPAVADELKSLIESEKPDLVVMGKQATDDDCNQVGQMLAAKLDWPQATFASKVTLGGLGVTVERETDTGEETLEMELPAVITVDLRLNEPRYIALPGIIKARNKPLDRKPATAKPVLKTRVLGYSSPPPRAAGRKVGSVDELVAALRDKGAL